MIFRVTGSYRTLKSATDSFSLNYYDPNGDIRSKIKQPQIELGLYYSPNKKASGYGVERYVINEGNFPTMFLGYSNGFKGVFDGDFNYQKIQALYTQPWNIGGLGRMYTTVEVGKIYGEVPLGLLSPIPGNQTLFSIYNTFNQLDYYEFVSDTYASFHMQHDFGGRLFGRIPWLRKLNLREVVGFRAVYGEISDENIALNASNIIYQAPEDIYWEWNVGIGNIFKIFRLDFNFRGNYLDNPDARKFGITGIFGFSF
jgi:hypothetical protein